VTREDQILHTDHWIGRARAACVELHGTANLLVHFGGATKEALHDLCFFSSLAQPRSGDSFGTKYKIKILQLLSTLAEACG
jgi:hypothetical protein